MNGNDVAPLQQMARAVGIDKTKGPKMNGNEASAIILARVACVNARVAGMQAANINASVMPGIPDHMYSEADFLRVIEEEGIHHNAVQTVREMIDE